MNYLVIDLEMCNVPRDYRSRSYKYANETIQIGAVLLDEEFKRIGTLSQYVHPEHGVIDPFIQNLTGIRNSQVKKAPRIEEALLHMIDWIGDREYKVYAWSGSDRAQLLHEIKAKKICDERILDFVCEARWIDYQDVFVKRFGIERKIGLEEALGRVEIKPEGRLHDGLDDAVNTGCFVQNVELIALRLKDLGAEYIHGGVDAGNENDQDTREGKIKRFHSDPKCMVLVANPAACSEGISLHRICQYAIYLDRSFNAAHYLQSEDRIHRLGLSSDARPTVEFVECEDSIDQVVRERLTLKVAIMASALNDSSLKVEPDIYEEDEEDESDMDNIANDLSVDDARAVIDYFFDGDSDA